MRSQQTFSLACLFWLLVLAPLRSIATESPVLLDKIVAVVNDEVITETGLAAAINQAKASYEQSKLPVPDRAVLKKEILDALIDRTLELQLARQANLTVSREELKEEIDQILASKKLALGHFKLTLQQQGTSFEAFQEELRTQLLIQKLQKEVLMNRIILNDEEVSQFIENYDRSNSEFLVRDLWIPLPDYPKPEEASAMKALAEKWHHALKTGSAAWGKSDSDASIQWLDLGSRKISEFPSLFATHILLIKPGSISPVLKAENGFHILQLVKQKFPDRSLTESKAKQMIYNEKARVQLKNWLEEVREAAYVRLF